MFVLKKSASYKWPVSFIMPSDGGIKEKQTFDAEFKRLSQKRINEIQESTQKRIKAAENGDIISDEITDLSVADEILVGWDNIQDEQGNEIPFTKATKKQLLDIPMLGASLIECYFQSLLEEKGKN